MINSEEIIDIGKKYYKSNKIEVQDDSIIFHIDKTENEGTFSLFLDQLNKIGYTAFTDKYPDYRIIVIREYNINKKYALKGLMLFLTVIAMVYTGYSYYEYYSSNLNLYQDLLNGTIYFVIPLLSIMFFREFGRFVALRKNKIKYSFPIFIPSPGLGTLGIITSSHKQFKTEKSMIMAGSYSIIFGFLLSIFMIVFGSLYEPTYLTHATTVNTSIYTLKFPLIFIMVINHIIPVNIMPPPIEMAGYIGLIITSINALPLGFMDGGLIFSALAGKKFFLFSYASLLILVVMSFVYPFFIILIIVALLLGIKGPLPLNNFVHPSRKIVSLAIVVILIAIAGFVPLPFEHNYPGNISVSMPTYFMVNKDDPGNTTFNVTVTNHGSAPITPLFSISKMAFKTISGGSMNIAPGHSAVYEMKLFTYKFNYTGVENYTFNVFAGSTEYKKMLDVYYVKAGQGLGFNNINPITSSNTSSNTNKTPPKYQNTNPLTINARVGQIISFNITNTMNNNVTLHLVSISNHMDTYMYNKNYMINITDDHHLLGNSITLRTDQSFNISLMSQTPGTWVILIYAGNLSGFVTINVSK